MTANDSIAKKLAEFDELVDWFQGEDFSIDKAAEKIRQAELLAGDIEQRLDDVQNDIVVLKQKFDRD